MSWHRPNVSRRGKAREGEGRGGEGVQTTRVVGRMESLPIYLSRDKIDQLLTCPLAFSIDILCS